MNMEKWIMETILEEVYLHRLKTSKTIIKKISMVTKYKVEVLILRNNSIKNKLNLKAVNCIK